jgi:hypothetical protein
MVPVSGEWNATLKRAAGRRGQERKLRLERQAAPPPTPDRKKILAAALGRKKS